MIKTGAESDTLFPALLATNKFLKLQDKYGINSSNNNKLN